MAEEPETPFGDIGLDDGFGDHAMYEYCDDCGCSYESCHCCGSYEAVKESQEEWVEGAEAEEVVRVERTWGVKEEPKVEAEEKACPCCAIQGNTRVESSCWFHSEQEREGALLTIEEAEELAILVKAAQDATRLLDDRLEWAAKAAVGTDFDAWWACRQGWKGEE